MSKIYLYGLQRSGTNNLETFIKENFNIIFNNQEIDRKSCSHKHFRFNDNKNSIPNTDVIGQYNNDVIINSIDELDIILNDYNHTNKYIVVYKDIFSWLVSIRKWATMCKWITNSNKDFLNDYLSFLGKWLSIKNDRVLFINYNDYLNLINDDSNDNSLLERLNNFLKTNISKDILNKKINKVKCSGYFTDEKKKYYFNKEYMNEFKSEEIESINKIISINKLFNEFNYK